MKTLAFFSMMVAVATLSFAQQTVEPFTKISATGNIKVVLANNDSHTISFNGSNEVPADVTYKISGGVLSIVATGNEEACIVKVTAPVVNEIDLKSVAELNTEGLFNAPQLKLTAEGATEYNMDLNCETLSLNLQGASEADLKGNANTFIAQLQGASQVSASELKTKSADISTEGASEIILNVSETLKAKGSGASVIQYTGEPTNVEVNVEGVADISKATSEELVEIEIENAEIREHNYPDHPESKEDEGYEFNGHWAGVDLMMNNFISSYGDINTAPGYDFMELNFGKSVGVNINFMEFNIPFYEGEKSGLGLTTGLGAQILNYRLKNDTRLMADSAVLMAYNDTMNNSVRSKLTATYLTLPLLFEFDFKGGDNKSQCFHVGVGAYGGVRIGSHSKVVVSDNGGKDKFKSNGDFHLNPFKYGVMARIGWSNINLFAQYALSDMFEAGEGPSVRPLEFGISFDIN